MRKCSSGQWGEREDGNQAVQEMIKEKRGVQPQWRRPEVGEWTNKLLPICSQDCGGQGSH